MPDFTVNQSIHGGQEGEGNKSCAYESCPVYVVEHVVRVHPQASHIVDQEFNSLVFSFLKDKIMSCFEELWDVQED